MDSTRSAYPQVSGLWVAIRQAPPSRSSSRNRAKIASVQPESWWAVGSSASSSVGDRSSARDAAQRCCSPSEVWFG